MLHRRVVRDHRTARDRKTKAPLALLAQVDAQGMYYAGSAFIALSGDEREEFRACLATTKIEHSPLPKFRFPDALWVKPQLMARVRYLAEVSTFGTEHFEESDDYHRRRRVSAGG
jgi:hypothetical protein